MNLKVLVCSFLCSFCSVCYIFADVMNFDSLQEAISSEELDKKYSFSGTEIVENDLGQLMGNSLIIEGIQQGSIIKAKESDICGITITGKQNLILNNISGFNNFKTAIDNYYGSSVTVNNTVFNGNKGALKGSAISNNGYLEVNNSTFSLNSSSYGGALINYRTETKLNNVLFENNSAHTGGAILNDVFHGIMHINNVIFSNNVATGQDGAYGGGAIKNKNILTITGNSLFNKNESHLSGGAIENRFYGSLNINDFVKFVENRAGSGGAIYNYEYSSATISGENIEFISNTARGYGGAIYNNISTMTISGENIEFSSNTANNGGAINNCEALMEISSGEEKIKFSFNTAEDDGGAINNNSKSIMMISGENIEFSSNVARSYVGSGGAIYNYDYSVMTISGENIEFSFNTAEDDGGAIYNENSTLNLLTTGKIDFTGNEVNGVSNAIHDNNGTINLYASENATIIFNDRITSKDSNSILNINQSTTTLNAIGKIVLNEDMSGYTGKVNLYGGEIELQSKKEEGTKVNKNKFFSGYITLSSGTLNIQNGAIDNITVNRLETTANANLKFDVDLSNNTSDNFTITNNANGELNLTAINILGIYESTGTITLFNNGVAPELNVLTTAYYGGYKYSFSTTAVNGELEYKLTGTEKKTFKEVVNDTVPVTRSYSLSVDEKVGEGLGDLGGDQLTIFGNGKNIEGEGVDGIYIARGKTLDIENVNKWSGFSGANGALINEGTLTISGTNFSDNGDKDIINNGNLILSGLASSFEKGIVGTGTTTVKGVEITLNDAKLEQGKIEIKENGSLITSATNVIGDIENNGNLVFNGGINNNKISGEGTLVVHDSVLNYAGITQKDINITNGFFSNYASEDITATTLRVGVNAVLDENGYNGGKINATKVYNDGFIGITQSDITNTSDYQGGGTLIFTETNFINNANIIQSTITINYASILTTDADKIKAIVVNEGRLILTGGENNNYILGIGTTTIDGSVVNNSTIENRVIINEINELITSATNVIGDIENNGKLVFNGGEINNNKITGLGLLNITAENIENNNTIEQSTITISGTNFTNNSIIKTIDFNLDSVDFKLTEKGDLTVENLSAKNSTIDIANSIINELNISRTLTVNEIFNLSVDADLANKQMDTITANDYSGNGKINIKSINILTDATKNKTEILFTSSTVLKDKITTIKTASSNLYKYDVKYNDGFFTFSKIGDDLVKTESQVATGIGGIITQTEILKQAFASIDSAIYYRYITYYEAKNRKSNKDSNLYASTTDLLYSEDANVIERGLWIRPYAMQDTININSLSVDNTAIGTLAGIDLSVGEESILSFYIGYAGSTQKYEDIKINQTGYVVGATGMIVEEDYYLGLTANVNFNKAESESNSGTDKFDINMYLVGAKAGYNIYLGEKWIIEPNLTFMYGNINTPEYTTKQGAGAKINSQSTTNILIDPQIKAKLDLTDGWTPYALVGYVLNSGDKTKLVVDGKPNDDMQITRYVEYGLGVNKSFKDSCWSCSLQVVGKGGDRDGFEGNLEIKYGF